MPVLVDVGERVSVEVKGKPIRVGTVRYIGDTYCQPGTWIGVELDDDTGKNDGSLEGVRYFECKPGRGLFVKPSSVKRAAAAREAKKTKAPSAAPKGSMARSHETNDAYMAEFDDILRAHGEQIDLPNIQDPSQIHVQSGVYGDGFHRYVSGMLSRQWYKEPINPDGILCDSSDRNVLCMDLYKNTFVLGNADHALYEYDLTGKKRRTLYTKTSGHEEWVTCVCYLPDGRIASGAMDKKICLWPSGGTRCVDLIGHSESVSCVMSSETGSYIISTSYDKSIIIWDTRSKCMSDRLYGHNAPILCMDWNCGYLLTGDRGSMAAVWDIGNGRNSSKLTGHKGHITSVRILPPVVFDTPLLYTGAQDGCVKIWDPRDTRHCVKNLPLHGCGAVGNIEYTNYNGIPYIATAGADNQVHILDIRNANYPLFTFTEHTDFIYSLHLVGDICLSGDGRGMLMAHDMKEGKLLYGLGANQAAVRCIDATENCLVASGDDGNALIYNF